MEGAPVMGAVGLDVGGWTEKERECEGSKWR